MANSQNGWPVVPTGTDARLVAIPKVLGRVRKGDVATILAYVVARFDATVEDFDAGRDDWGYANRPVTGGTVPSNHASGTAIDLNATRHPIGRVNTFTSAQRAAIKTLLKDLEGTVRWGGDYPGRKDEMHFEINAGASACRKVAERISGTKPVDNPIPTPPTVTKRKPKPLPPVRKQGSSGGWVGLWQSIARDCGIAVAVDTDFGPATTRATKALQRRWGLKDDGIVGPKTWLRALLSDRSGALTYGDYNAQVELLQNLLGIKLDRSYGSNTREAVRQMQRYLGITADGSCGPKTVAALHVFYGV